MVRFVWLDITYTVSKNVNSPRISYAQTKKKYFFLLTFFGCITFVTLKMHFHDKHTISNVLGGIFKTIIFYFFCTFKNNSGRLFVNKIKMLK